MTATHAIFDRDALLRHRARAARVAVANRDAAPDFLLRRVAEDFSDRLSLIKRSFGAAIDLGCHHGVLRRTLENANAIPFLTSADECADLLAQADAPRALVNLERLPFAPNSADLVVSGLALQTVNDLPGTLAQIQATLRPDGLFLAALMGGRSLFELRDALLSAETELTEGASPRIAPMVDVRDLGTLLQRARFALPVVDSDVVTVTYAHPLALLHDLRGMGATNCLAERPRTFLRRAVLLRAFELYAERHANADGRIRATFEILTATAWGPHESQQKPLKPGSATTRLADALRPPKT
jgi:NADH dehydrogenase [ubiquinone] 1 alpha subcomplex assembly factor 5